MNTEHETIATWLRQPKINGRKDSWKCKAADALESLSRENAEQAARIAELQAAQGAQGAQEPVAWLVQSKTGMIRTAWTEAPDAQQLEFAACDGDTVTPLYRHAAPIPVLTDAEIDDFILKALRDTKASERVRKALTREVGPYDIDTPTFEAKELIRTILASAVSKPATSLSDSERLDWLEGEMQREEEWFASDRSKPLPHSLFRTNMPITRAAIDAAMQEQKGTQP